jgi:DNA-directed RNA polymerase specialized sigma24 family protein
LKLEHGLSAGEQGRFHTTQWTVVLLAAQSRAPRSQTALADLCTTYWHPLYTFIRLRGYNPHDAQDLTQGFFLHLLENKPLFYVSPSKGKFRSFQLASIQNYLSDARTVLEPADIDDEIHGLCEALIASEGRLAL